MDEFFHGVRVTDVPQKLVVISQVNSGTVAVIGTAPEAEPGMKLVSSAVDKAQYGASVFDGRTIPHVLDILFANGNPRVVVINVVKDSHKVAVANEAHVVGSVFDLPLQHIPIDEPLVKTVASDGDPAEVLVKDVDYTFEIGDQSITIINRSDYPRGTNLTVSYTRFNAAGVLPVDVIGGTDINGVRTGIALLDLAFPRFKLTPKILISPFFVEEQTVCTALLVQAKKLRGRVLVDADSGTTKSEAIESRNTSGDVVNFNTGETRLVGCFPYLYKPDPKRPEIDGQPFPLSAYLAAVWTNVIAKLGIQYSPSNKAIVGVSKSTVELSCTIGDETSDISQLNSAGIVTINTGSGIKTWGNRNMGFPDSNAMDTFLSVQLVRDMVDESVQAAAIEFQDLPINLAWIDLIVDSVQSFLNTLIASGALIDGTITYNAEENSPASMSQGKFKFHLNFLPPPPGELIEFDSLIDVSLFNKIIS